MIMYLNLLSMGYSLKDYMNFIIRRSECIIGVFGFVVMSLIILWKGDNNGLHI